MKPGISAIEYALDPAPRTFDPEKDFWLGWEVETNSDDAESVVLEHIEIRARENGIQFRSLVRVLATELGIKKGQATELAFEWAFSHSAAGASARLVDHRPRTRGRPRRVVELTTVVNRPGLGWWRATGERPGTSYRAPSCAHSMRRKISARAPARPRPY
jgi:hypothetical protein